MSIRKEKLVIRKIPNINGVYTSSKRLNGSFNSAYHHQINLPLIHLQKYKPTSKNLTFRSFFLPLGEFSSQTFHLHN